MISLFPFVLLGLATFRLTRLFVYDQITNFIRAPFHDVKEEVQADGSTETVLYIKGTGIVKFIGELLSCHWCMGIWCAAFLYVGHVFFPLLFTPFIVILSIAAVASIMEEWIR